MISRTATYGDGVRALSSVIIIAQSDSIKYVIGLSKKISLEKLLLRKVLFPSLNLLRTDSFWKELAYLFYKSLPPFLTFVNCECPYLAEVFLHNLCQYLDIVSAQLRVITRTRNKFVETVAVAERYLIINSCKK